MNPDDKSSRSSLVAIVDDEALVRVALRRLCGVLGFATTDHASGREFLAALDSGVHPDCVLLDAHMPDMTGLDVQRLLVARGVQFPTIMFTADDALEAQARYIAAGAVGCLCKPMSGEELLAAIDSAIAARRGLLL